MSTSNKTLLTYVNVTENSTYLCQRHRKLYLSMSTSQKALPTYCVMYDMIIRPYHVATDSSILVEVIKSELCTLKENHTD